MVGYKAVPVAAVQQVAAVSNPMAVSATVSRDKVPVSNVYLPGYSA